MQHLNTMASVADSTQGEGGDECGQLADVLLMAVDAVADEMADECLGTFDAVQYSEQVVNQ